jgi:hypothetical protein
VAAGALAGLGAIAGCARAPAPASPARPPSAGAPVTTYTPTLAEQAFLDTLGRRTFDWFWETTNPRNGLTPDRWPTKSFSSVAATGYALTAYPIGVERGWVARDAARARVLTTLRFLWRLPQGPQSTGVAGHRGFFYHFLDMETGLRFEQVELSTIDTALLLAGVLTCREYFDGTDPGDVEIRALADSLNRRVDWDWARAGRPLVSMGWHPERRATNQDANGFILSDWRGYMEAMLLYALALGSPTHPVPAETWQTWTRTYQWDRFHGQEFVQFAPLFGHQYSHVWIDFRGIQDAYMRGRGDPSAAGGAAAMDYHENSRRATLSQQAYAVANPGRLARLLGRRLGAHGERRAARRDAHHRRARAHLPLVLGARRGPRRDQRRRHHRPHRRRRLDRVRARGRDPDARRDAPALRRRPVRALRLPRRVQPDAARPRRARRRETAARAHRAREGMVRHRLPWHRSGTDPRDAREPANGARMAHDAQERGRGARPLSRGIHGRVAGGAVLTGVRVRAGAAAALLAAAACAGARARPATGDAVATTTTLRGDSAGRAATSLRPVTAVEGAASGTTRPASVTPALSDARVSRIADSVLALMTLEEKLGQLTQSPAGWGQTGPSVEAGGDSAVRAGRVGSFLSLWGADVTRRMQRIAVEESRLKIPLVFGYDVIHGMRTIFPVPLAMAATFDSAAAVRMARISAVEATAMGVHWTFAPMVDIARDARWGRIVEGAGEDPYLGSVMAAAQVVGYQGGDLRDSQALLATAKHFAAYGAAEAGRDYNVVNMGERRLWEVYMPPFEAAARAGVGRSWPRSTRSTAPPRTRAAGS